MSRRDAELRERSWFKASSFFGELMTIPDEATQKQSSSWPRLSQEPCGENLLSCCSLSRRRSEKELDVAGIAKRSSLILQWQHAWCDFESPITIYESTDVYLQLHRCLSPTPCLSCQQVVLYWMPASIAIFVCVGLHRQPCFQISHDRATKHRRSARVVP